MSPRTTIITVGRRKTAVARLRVNKKSDDKLTITVNDKDFKIYFPYFEWQDTVMEPLIKTGTDKINVSIKVLGGGVRSQAESIRHALARAIVKLNPDSKATLRKEGFLTRDDRKKERKKPGLKKARRAPQWSKR